MRIIKKRSVSARRLLAAVLLTIVSSGQSILAAQEFTERCGDERKSLSELLQQARLKGDNVQLNVLGERLKTLNLHCRGMIPLQTNQPEVERASQLADEREAQLREALGQGNPHVIELRKEQLDQARKQLKAAKR